MAERLGLSLLVSLAGPEGGEVAGGGFLFSGGHGGKLESQEAQDGGTEARKGGHLIG